MIQATNFRKKRSIVHICLSTKYVSEQYSLTNINMTDCSTHRYDLADSIFHRFAGVHLRSCSTLHLQFSLGKTSGPTAKVFGGEVLSARGGMFEKKGLLLARETKNTMSSSQRDRLFRKEVKHVCIDQILPMFYYIFLDNSSLIGFISGKTLAITMNFT